MYSCAETVPGQSPIGDITLKSPVQALIVVCARTHSNSIGVCIQMSNLLNVTACMSFE